MRVEPYGAIDNSNIRPDITIQLDDPFCCLHLDVRTCDPLLKSFLPQSCESSGIAADAGALDKDRHWQQAVQLQGDSFIPLCHEFPGLIGQDALLLLSQSVSLLLDHAGGTPLCSRSTKARDAFRTHWLQRLHMTNTRGAADVILARRTLSLHIPSLLANTLLLLSPLTMHTPLLTLLPYQYKPFPPPLSPRLLSHLLTVTFSRRLFPSAA